MPNWCSNRLIIRGSSHRLVNFSELEGFIEQSGGPGSLLFSGLAPEPAHPNTDPDYDWYAWRILNWGTKWEPNLTDFHRSGPGDAHYAFDTPWGPPEPWLKTASERFPALSFSLEYNDGEGDTGRITAQAGTFSQKEGLPSLSEILAERGS